MDLTGYSFIKAITIDLIEIEFFRNEAGQYKTISTFKDGVDPAKITFYENFQQLYYIFSDYIENKELKFEPCVIIFRHSKKPS